MTTLRQHIPAPLKKLARIVVYVLLDAWDAIRGHREPMMPPRKTLLIVGSGDFKQVGRDFCNYLVQCAALKPEHKVLEIGAGWGRMAVGLTSYLKPPGSYDGIEIIRDAVGWCANEITSRYPHFRFHHADVKNPYSNPDGAGHASQYRVPFDDASFDLIFLTSVFSHMPPNEIDAYLGEISRVLKPNGRTVITYFVLDDYARRQIAKRRASQPFYHEFDGYLSTSRDTPENTIAIPEQTIRDLYRKHSLEIDQPIVRGSWSGCESTAYQDVVLAIKAELTAARGRDADQTR